PVVGRIDPAGLRRSSALTCTYREDCSGFMSFQLERRLQQFEIYVPLALQEGKHSESRGARRISFALRLCGSTGRLKPAAKDGLFQRRWAQNRDINSQVACS